MTPLVAMTVLLLAQGPAKPAAERTPEATAAADVVAALETTLADAIARAEPSVVSIHRRKGSNPDETRAVRGRQRAGAADHDQVGRIRLDYKDLISFDYGSGVVIGGDGEILTAFHVVRGADLLVVRAAGGQVFAAEVIAADPRSDLAVIAPVEDKEAERPKLKPIPLGDSTRLRKGSFLIALGNHFNAARADGSASASWGILSGVARRIDDDTENSAFGGVRTLALRNYPTLLQLDAKLNLGMSGGAVINLKGELVGVTTTAASPSGYDALAGYAIPMDRMGRRIVETLRQGKEVEYGLLGIRTRTPLSTRVTETTPNSPAARGALQSGDEILAVNGVPIENFDALILAVGAYSPGDAIRLKVRRNDATVERTLMLAKYPVSGEVIATNRPSPWRGVRVDFTTTLSSQGFGLGDLDPAAGGVVVTSVEEGSPAAAAGLRKGAVILRVGDRPVQSPRTFAEAVHDREGPVTLETDIGPVTVGAHAEASRPGPADPPRR